MKRKSIEADDSPDPETRLYEALLSLRNIEEMAAFFRDLCTPAEREALTDRWRVVPWLRRGVPYREIKEHTGVSVTPIGRVARFLGDGHGGYRIAASRVLPDAESPA